MSDLRVVEINGIKVEVDMRTAKRVDQYKVGDPVKVLVKKYSDYEAHSGVIVGFDEFNKLPTITVAYIVESYSEVEIKFTSINAQSKDVELAPLQEYDMKFDYNKALKVFDRDILKKERDLEDAKLKKEWFLKHYGKLFSMLFKID